ncbi:uncharacterized protein LOC128033970 [Gossypium raimondii]|uniref:uncharacterized protein LOC128033970 n=1 Tax=Gossypium raimondii TaxID=29730 RepID=UPI00227C7DED|nr:uncharacterized protein LOC128033970 [Gossypium raimondii]
MADALSRKTVAALLSLQAKMTMFDDGALLAKLVVKQISLSLILEEQMKDAQCDRLKQRMLSGKAINFSVGNDGELRFRNMLFVRVGNGLRKELLKEAHHGTFSLHSGSIKMYRDLKDSYWWLGIKKEISEITIDFLSGYPSVRPRRMLSGGS